MAKATKEKPKEMTKLSAEQQKQIIQKYHQRYHKAERGMDKKHKMWATIDMFDRGEQWAGANIPPWVPKPVTNFIRFIRTVKRANLASAIPKAQFYPEYQEDAETVTQLQKAYDYVWDRKKVNRIVRRSVDRALLQGTSIVMVYTDDTYVGGKFYADNDTRNQLFQGDLCIKRIPNGNFFPDPDAYCIEDGKFHEVTEVLSLNVIKENPTFQEYVGDRLKELKYSHIGQSSDETGAIYDRENNPMHNGQNVEGDELVTLHTHYERYLKDGKYRLDITYYIRDTDFILYRIEDAKPNEYPFAVLYDEEEENDFWGTSTTMDILENQKIVNKLQQTAAIIGVLHQNPQKVVQRESGINAQEMAQTGTLPGKVWTSNIPNPVEIIKPMDIPRALFELDDRTQNNIKDMVGVNEAYMGQSVGSLTTSTGVDSLIERATIRDKDKLIQVDDFVERISHLIVLNILFKWQDKRPISNVQPDGSVTFDEYEPVEKLTAENLTWKVKSDVYAKAPTTQAAKRQQADKLMQMQGQFNFNPPIITPEEWIRFQEFEDRESILARMKKDREKLESQNLDQMAQMVSQMASQVQQLKGQGLPDQQIQQMIQQQVMEILGQQQQEEMKNGLGNAPMTRPKDATATPQMPQGVTGQVQMANMANGM